MSDFFNTSDLADINLLHSTVRNHDELDNVVDSVEWEIIDSFTQRESLGLSTVDAFFEYESGADPTASLEVRLVGYDSATPANSEAGLKIAIKRTIADIVSWVLREYTNTQGVQSISQGRRSITYSGTVPSWREWPDGWDIKLSNYNAKHQNFGI